MMSMKTHKITILYIATGRYIAYWPEFYEGMMRHFLPECERRVLLFTDAANMQLPVPDNVELVEIPQHPWPYITLLRYHMFLEHAALWQDADYVFFLNANYRFYRHISTGILPGAEDGGLVAGVHRFSGRKTPDKYPYERDPASTACIPYGQGTHYFAGGFNGGTARAFYEMCCALREQIQADVDTGAMAKWHDESHLNRYLLNRPVRVLPATYVWAEEKVRWYNRWRIYAGPRDKRSMGGHEFMRGLTGNKG